MYLGSEVSIDNSIGTELQKRLIAAKKYYCGLLKHLSSSLLSRKSRVTLYKMLIGPVGGPVKYGEVWQM
jgi:hypothetical protein